MKNDSIEIPHLLSLSYNDLSSTLKRCFLYVGIFPEDHVISTEKLMWLWMANEFIPQGNKMEDITEDYLHELISRSLLQVAGRSWGRIITCRMHDLLRDLAVEKAMEVNLFDMYDPGVYTGAPSRRRRHAIHTQIEKFFSVGLPGAKLRLLVFFNPDFENPDIGNFTIICQKFKYLSVLDLENVYFGSHFGNQRLPNAIGHLTHMKFLGLIRTNFTELPSDIGNLKSLQILEILAIDGFPCRFPMEMSKLINLRYFYVHHSEGLLKIDTLTNLTTLRGVSYEQWMNNDTINLVNLRELVLVTIQSHIVGKAYTLGSIGKLKSLTTLILQSYETLPSLEPLSSCPHLLRLWLNGRTEKLPPSNKLPQSLTTLKLIGSRLSEDPMPTLEKLLNLRRLDLDDAYVGKEIICNNNGFYQLEYLRLSRLANLENWRLAEMAMPVIKSLSIIGCPKLETLPERLNSITLLAELEHELYHRLPYHLC